MEHAFLDALLAIASSYSDDFKIKRVELFTLLTQNVCEQLSTTLVSAYFREDVEYLCVSSNQPGSVGQSIRDMSQLLTSEASWLCNVRGAVITYGFFHIHRAALESAIVNTIESFSSSIGMLLDLFALRAQAQGDLANAQRIQRNLLPRVLPRLSELQIAARFRPARVVSGDYYNVFVQDNLVTIVVADVAGKGIGAALIMAALTAQVNQLRRRNPRQLEEIVASLNSMLHDSTPPELYVTLQYSIIDLESFTMTYVNCGHQPPALHIRGRDGRVKQLDVGGVMLGLFPTDTQTFEVGEAPLENGDLILLGTDGLTDAENDQGIDFGLGGLLSCGEAIPTSFSAEDAVDFVFSKIDHFVDRTREQQDDMTLLCVRLGNNELSTRANRFN